MRNVPEKLPLSIEEFEKKYTALKYASEGFHLEKVTWFLRFNDKLFTGITKHGNHPVFTWYVNGEIHRYNGPAMVGYNDFGLITRVTQNWYLYDKKIDYAQYKKFCIKYKLDFNNLTPEDEILIKMYYS